MEVEECVTLTFCGVQVFDFDTVDGVEGHWQYNDVLFHISELKQFNGRCVEVYEDWKIVIWGEKGEIIKDFYIMESEEFRERLYNKYPN